MVKTNTSPLFYLQSPAFPFFTPLTNVLGKKHSYYFTLSAILIHVFFIILLTNIHPSIKRITFLLSFSPTLRIMLHYQVNAPT